MTIDEEQICFIFPEMYPQGDRSAISTMPSISFTVSRLASVQAALGYHAFVAAKKLMRYIAGKKDSSLYIVMQVTVTRPSTTVNLKLGIIYH